MCFFDASVQFLQKNLNPLAVEGSRFLASNMAMLETAKKLSQFPGIVCEKPNHRVVKWYDYVYVYIYMLYIYICMLYIYICYVYIFICYIYIHMYVIYMYVIYICMLCRQTNMKNHEKQLQNRKTCPSILKKYLLCAARDRCSSSSVQCRLLAFFQQQLILHGIGQ